MLTNIRATAGVMQTLHSLRWIRAVRQTMSYAKINVRVARRCGPVFTCQGSKHVVTAQWRGGRVLQGLCQSASAARNI